MIAVFTKADLSIPLQYALFRLKHFNEIGWLDSDDPDLLKIYFQAVAAKFDAAVVERMAAE